MRRILATAVVAILAAGMVGLGVWQLRRLSERRAHNAEIVLRMAEPPISLNDPISNVQSLDFHSVVVEGT
ncbi:MAG: SURF1 family protein, partial [Chloroflexi bacterium]|nr:SURF1 family protein [Chloroflexota bacterium]